MIHDYAGGRKMSPPERLLFSAAAEHPALADIMGAFGTRGIGPAQMMARALPRAALAGARRALLGRGGSRAQLAGHGAQPHDASDAREEAARVSVPTR
jgi:hypothetical protein